MSAFPPVAELLPHAGNMILLDEVLSCENDALTARFTIRPCPYSLENGGLPPWMGLEILAQGIAAWAGIQTRRAGESVKLGFLLGTRRYDCHVDIFPANAAYVIRVENTMQDANGMCIFECRMQDADQAVVAQARLNVYQPSDSSLYTQEPTST
ncbi:hotdog family protein [Azonexus sp.]|jgi:predicted hotdog family 3-hydroxylacyl-ACP dehydratase|uniref:hotdog family protein n=1 Tax=Azonexus sp. TaxID=1872668 RepID=UPI002827E08F|nr:hotdog family protein [Azonexus sp.]MDR1994325.1 hotdog family protein [Azonexus sp.]